MKGRDITRMKGWDKLKASGFEAVRFKGQMGFYEIGAALPMPGTLRVENGRRVWVDMVTVEPAGYFTNAKGKRVGHWTVDVRGQFGLIWCEGRGVVKAALEAVKQ